jgi:hypothetical protein
MNRTTWIAATAACALAAAGSAQATTYFFVVDGCTGGCGASPTTPVGTVVTSQEAPGVIDVLVTLTNGGAFHDTDDRQHHALAFDLSGTPTITVSDLGTPFTANGSQASSTVDDAGLGTFEYVINFPKVKGAVPVETSFSFDITGPGVTLDSFVSNGTAYFGSDIWAGPLQTGNTGNVGALPGAGPGVPEPATWAMMIVGMGLAGTALRRRRTLLAS